MSTPESEREQVANAALDELAPDADKHMLFQMLVDARLRLLAAERALIHIVECAAIGVTATGLGGMAEAAMAEIRSGGARDLGIEKNVQFRRLPPEETI